MNKYMAILFWIAGSLSARVNAFAQHGRPLYDASTSGVEAHTYRKSFPIDVAKTLDTIKMMGFTELEGGGARMAPEEFRKLCDERGISIPSIGAGYDQLVKSPDSVIDKAKILGATYVMCAWIPHTDGSVLDSSKMQKKPPMISTRSARPSKSMD